MSATTRDTGGMRDTGGTRDLREERDTDDASATRAVATPRRVLPVLVAAQFAGVSPWFAVNAVMPDLQRELGWPPSAVGTLTASLQAGFVAGTLAFALLAIADRFRARTVFLVCACAGALLTAIAPSVVHDVGALTAVRALTGVALAGVYPVGMKIASQWYRQGLGSALGWLLGALVLGSASPHAVRGMVALSSADVPWASVMYAVAVLAALGGVVLYAALPEPPPSHATRAARMSHGAALATVWTDRRVRASVFGYFGHMWELYAVWVLAPLVLATRLQGATLSFAAFAVAGAGVIGCVGGGWLATRHGSARVAAVQLAASGACCFLAPLAIDAPALVFGAWLLLWGVTVSGDSPQFSALTARNAPPQGVGSVLLLANSIGFAITTVSIELFTRLAHSQPLGTLLPWLGVGPLLGLWALRPLLARDAEAPPAVPSDLGAPR